MKNTQSALSLLDGLYTIQDVSNYVKSLEDFAATLFLTQSNPEQKLFELFSKERSSRLIEFCRENNISFSDHTQFETLIKNLKEEIDKLPVLELTVAFAVREPFVVEIGDWVSQTTKKRIMLAFVTDKTVIGGVVLGLNGIYKDLSVRVKLEEYFMKNSFGMLVDEKVLGG